MDGDSEERVHGWRKRGRAWMGTVKRERECMDGDSEEREGVHGWR